MSITDLAAMKAMALIAERQSFYKVNTGSIAITGKLVSSWILGPIAGSAPGAAAAPTRSTTGALVVQTNGATPVLRLVQAYVESGSGYLDQSSFVLCDRLSHQSGLSGTSTSAQTTNLPTAALTRYTDGIGVMAALEIYSALGATATSVSISYTNQAGTAGRVSPDIAIGGTGDTEGTRILPIPLAQGDTGVKSVQSVTLAASTGTVGDFGVTLYKPLFQMPGGRADLLTDETALFGFGGAYPEIVDNACLFFISRGESNATNGPWAGSLLFAQDL